MICHTINKLISLDRWLHLTNLKIQQTPENGPHINLYHPTIIQKAMISGFLAQMDLTDSQYVVLFLGMYLALVRKDFEH